MPPSAAEQAACPSDLIRNRNFVLLCLAYAISALGDHLSEMAILKTQDALNPAIDITPLTARMTFVFFFPFLLLAPIAGMLADRLPRRALMVVADLGRCAILFFFAAMIAFTQAWSTWGPFLPLLLVGALAAIFSPARSALLPALIRPGQLVRANGVISGLGIVATMAAAKIGGYLAEHLDPMVAFRINAGTFLVSAILLAAMCKTSDRVAHGSPNTTRSVGDELRSGFHYASHHRHVRELLAIAALVWFCGPLVNCVIPAVVRDRYAGNYTSISNYRALLGAGFILGAIIISILGEALRGDLAMTWGLYGIAVAIALFAASAFLPFDPSTLAALGGVSVVLTGLFAVGVMASLNSLLQRTVADRYRGRIFGVTDLCSMAALLLATGVLGVPSWTRMDRWAGFILLSVAVLTFFAGLITMWVRLGRGTRTRGLTFAENLNEFLAKFWWRLERLGRSTVPKEGAVILTANHTCSADPLFLSAAASYRTISFMVAEEYTHWPIVRFFLRLVECIPVKRDGRDTAATKRAIRHLREGKALGIFIEGRIVAPGERVVPKDGVAMLALKTGATVIPAHISGVRHHDSVVRGLLARHRARVRFGRPVDLGEFMVGDPDREQTRAATRKIYAAIQALSLTNEGAIESVGPSQRTLSPREQTS